MNSRRNVSYQMENHTVTTEFVLLGFGDLHHMQILLFVLFLLVYLVTITGNLLVILLVVANQHLHTPMYFFIGNLSCLETCYSSTLLPRMLISFLTGDRTISVSSCIAQFYFFGCLAGTECFLLSAMSYDRYSAICNPLRYPSVMNNKTCFILASSSWTGGFAVNTLIVSFMSRLTFYGPNKIDHFFCDFAPLMELACSDTHLIIIVDLVFSTVCALPPFLLTLASYVCIIATILRIPSNSGRRKAFSTCSSYLTVVTSFFGTLILVYIVPSSPSTIDIKKIFSVFYTVLTPLVNPLVYSFRNEEVSVAFRKFASKYFHFQKN